MNVFSSFMIYESSPQPITWNKLYASNASPENSSPKKALQKDRSILNSKNWSCHRRNNGIGGFRENLVTFREPKLPDF